MSAIKYRSSVNDAWQDLQVVVGPQGPAGATGPVGATGATGAAGADGRGISSITLNNDYTLTITFTDNTSTTTGSIRGPQGEQGPAGSGASLTAGNGIDITNGVISATVPELIMTSISSYDLTVSNCPQTIKDALLAVLNGKSPLSYAFYLGSTTYGRGDAFFYISRVYKDNYGWYVDITEPVYRSLSLYPSSRTGCQFTFDKNEPHALTGIDWFNAQSASFIVASSSANLTGSNFSASLNDNLTYIKNNYPKTSDLATVATSGSYNDLTNTPTIPSLTGYATETYVNQAVGAIPTYSAGTGISISNGVISLDLTNANGVSY